MYYSCNSVRGYTLWLTSSATSKYGTSALDIVNMNGNKKLRAIVLAAAKALPASADPETAARLGQAEAVAREGYCFSWWD